MTRTISHVTQQIQNRDAQKSMTPIPARYLGLFSLVLLQSSTLSTSFHLPSVTFPTLPSRFQQPTKSVCGHKDNSSKSYLSFISCNNIPRSSPSRSTATIATTTTSTRSPIMPSRSSSALQLSQYSSQAVSLFNNMKTPASIIAGAIVPLGFLTPLPLEGDKKTETAFQKALRRLYPVVALMSLASELISVMWATVAVNQLMERQVKETHSVWELLQGDYSLPWAGTNAHFVWGMLGFMYMIGTRMYFQVMCGTLGKSLAGMALSGLLLMAAIVNRGVAAGGGDTAERYGSSVLSLWTNYIRLLLQQATRPDGFGFFEISSLMIFSISFIVAIRDVIVQSTKKSKSD